MSRLSSQANLSSDNKTARINDVNSSKTVRMEDDALDTEKLFKVNDE